MKPSELTEGQWITLSTAEKKRNTVIGFHVEYSQFACFSMHPKSDVESGEGLLITQDRELADKIYDHYKDNEHVTVTTGGGYNGTGDYPVTVVRTGKPMQD